MALKRGTARTLRRLLPDRVYRLSLPQRRFDKETVALRPIRGAVRYALDLPLADAITAYSMNLAAVVQAADRQVEVLRSRFGFRPVLRADRETTTRMLAALAKRSEPFYVTRHRNGRSVTRLVRDHRDQPDDGDHLTVFVCIYDTESGRNHSREHGTIIEVGESSGQAGEVQEVDLYGQRLRTAAIPLSRGPFEVNFPIDAVYMWVDGNDPEWQLRRDKRLQESGRPLPSNARPGATTFLQYDELRYSLRSLQRNAPWLRRVFLVTDGQRPDWLDSRSNITLIDHREILPEDALPTFNSHAIASTLHRIPGLADHFVLFNDDVFVGRPLRPERLFVGNGMARFFLSKTPLPDGPETIHDRARLKTARMIEAVAGFRPTHVFKHTPIAFNRVLLEELEKEFSQEYEATARRPFRTGDDVVVEYLHHYLGYARRLTIPGQIRYGYYGFGSATGMTALRRYRRSAPVEVFCVNDLSKPGESNPELVGELQAILAAEFPHSSPYESTS